MKNITRTISKITIKADQVKYVSGVMEVKELTPLITAEKLSDSAIKKHFEKIAETGTTIVVKETAQEDKLYSITVENFIKYSEENKTVETAEKTEPTV